MIGWCVFAGAMRFDAFPVCLVLCVGRPVFAGEDHVGDVHLCLHRKPTCAMVVSFSLPRAWQRLQLQQIGAQPLEPSAWCARRIAEGTRVAVVL